MLRTKISLLTHEELDNLVKIMNTKYASYLKDRFFEIDVQSSEDAVDVKICLRNQQDSYHYPVEGKLFFKEQNLNPKDAALFLIDYIDFYFDEFFKENGEVYLTIDWGKHNFESTDFYLKGQLFNLEREKLADELLNSAH